MQGSRRSLGRRLRDTLLVVAITLLLGEGLARILTKPAENGMPAVLNQPLLPFRPDEALVEKWIASVSASKYIVGDPELGWTIAKSAKGKGLYESNPEGARASANRIYGPTAPAGKIRIVVVGDSFTHGDEVQNDETWAALLETMRPDLEVINLGVPAYGTDQAYLRWRRDGVAFSPQVSILGIWPEDICRNLNVVRYYLTPGSSFMTKPRFVLERGALALVNSPVLASADLPHLLAEPESSPLLAREYWYDARETTPKAYRASRVLSIVASMIDLMRRRSLREALYSGEIPAGDEITVRIAEAFANEAKEKGSRPLVLLIPMREHIGDKKLYAAENSLPLVRDLRRAGLEVLDMGPPLAKAGDERGLSQIYLSTGHLSPLGNRILAEALEAELRPHLADLKR
jgi:hypothetical protein